MRELTDLENRILIHCMEQGYKWAALNDNHLRLFEQNEKPFLKGSMYRIYTKEGWTILGTAINVPGLFQNTGYRLIELSKIEFQQSLF